MKLNDKQIGVMKRIIVGLIIAFAIVVGAAVSNPFAFNSSASTSARLTLVGQWLLLPAIFLVVSIGRLAKHRFFSNEDIDGNSISGGTERATMLQSLIQNTLEQFCITFVIYFAWAVIMPGQFLSVIPVAAVVFAIGRIMFFVGYGNGAASRALGFALTFYPSVIMLLGIFSYALWLRF